VYNTLSICFFLLNDEYVYGVDVFLNCKIEEKEQKKYNHLLIVNNVNYTYVNLIIFNNIFNNIYLINLIIICQFNNKFRIIITAA